VLTEFDDMPAAVTWEHAEIIDVAAADLEQDARPDGSYAEPVAAAAEARNYARWSKDFVRWIRNDQALELYRSPTFKLVSRAGESEGEFRARLQLVAHEKRDIAVGKLRKKYETRVSRLEQRQLRAEQKLATEQEQATQSKIDTAVAFGTAVLGAFLGRKRVSATSARQEAGDVQRAREILADVKQQLEQLAEEFDAEVAKLEAAADAQAEELDTIAVRAKSSDIRVAQFGLAWAPFYQSQDGELTAAWT
jgi:hypothetical protein